MPISENLGLLMAAPRPWLADGGLETSMIFHEGLDLPNFAAFVLLDSDAGRAALERYFARFIAIAAASGTGFVLDTVTWRAGTRWGGLMGLDEAATRAVNTRAVAFAADLRARSAPPGLKMVINGVIGPSGDGYRAGTELDAEAAEALHRPQVEALAAAGVDMVSAVTMTHLGEAVGIARAAARAGIAAAVSFTVETDGRLPSGMALAEAVASADAATGGSPLFYMVNCAHPAHFARELWGPWVGRVGGIRANASRLSHAELDEATELDDGDPEEFGHFYGAFARVLPGLKLVGGCCGSDHRHVGCAAGHLHATAA